ncbi:GIY-YIG nuclease family protein [Virgibacillus halodenitrificans]|uniref:GIY-YIG nuclease family protein n=1 Tax=Virgibacillus halodenitrificans TaxID=1482 RepID=UPI0013CEB065
MYIYRFLNKNREIIYIGSTKNIYNRISNQHFSNSGHLEPKQYSQVDIVEYAKVSESSDRLLLENYLITKIKPPFNKREKKYTDEIYSNIISEVNNLNWIKYEQESFFKRKNVNCRTRFRTS